MLFFFFKQLCVFKIYSVKFLYFKSKTFKASKLSTYDFSTLYTTLTHHLINDKLIDLINRTFFLACNEECAFF